MPLNVGAPLGRRVARRWRSGLTPLIPRHSVVKLSKNYSTEKVDGKFELYQHRNLRFLASHKPNPLGITGNGFYFGFTLWIGSSLDCTQEICISKFRQFLAAAPNEVGDTLAGIAGSLAFVWIIVTVLLQSQALSEQRKELSLNRAESKRMATAMEEQARIFRDEQAQRKQMQLDKLFHQRLKSIFQNIYNEVNRLQKTESSMSPWMFEIDVSGDEALLFHTMHDALEQMLNAHQDNEYQVFPLGQFTIRALINVSSSLDATISMFKELSPASQQKFDNLRIRMNAAFVHRILDINQEF